MGTRIALGAPAAGLRRMFLARGLLLAGIGSALGPAAAAGVTRRMRSVLFGVAALDPLEAPRAE